jgi:hypothetical protein
MLEEHLKQLTEQLQLDPLAPKDEQHLLHLSINPSTTLTFKELDPGFFLTCRIGPCPKEKREDLFILLMRANFLGQGTGGGTINLDRDENFLTLSLFFPYDLNYKAFKEVVEDFVNYVGYWREELARHEQAAKSILE